MAWMRCEQHGLFNVCVRCGDVCTSKARTGSAEQNEAQSGNSLINGGGDFFTMQNGHRCIFPWSVTKVQDRFGAHNTERGSRLAKCCIPSISGDCGLTAGKRGLGGCCLLVVLGLVSCLCISLGAKCVSSTRLSGFFMGSFHKVSEKLRCEPQRGTFKGCVCECYLVFEPVIARFITTVFPVYQSCNLSWRTSRTKSTLKA